MSDGLSRRLSSSGPATKLADNVQKLFPFEMSSRPLAIAHHGQNLLAGRAVGEIIAEHEIACRNVASVREMAQKIHFSLDNTVREELKRLRADGVEDGCGFWVGGYGMEDDRPSAYEIFWAPGGDNVEFKPMIILTEGGDGKRFSEAARKESARFNFTEHGARDWNLSRWNDYLERLYKAAASRPGANEVFGGKRWLLWIEKTGHKWIRK
jgi:hypothetical protein